MRPATDPTDRVTLGEAMSKPPREIENVVAALKVVRAQAAKARSRNELRRAEKRIDELWTELQARAAGAAHPNAIRWAPR